MERKILVDALYPEEVRAVLLDKQNNILKFESQNKTKKNLKGNIYLAKVVHIEPALQAAFIEYGAEKHGFIALSEIHPDYYQIPIADKEKLMKLVAEGENDAELTHVKKEFFSAYKIQEVIKKEQLILVQVEKEERGNKCASMTTYITLSGKYAVLMPSGFGKRRISKKITEEKEVKRLRSILEDFYKSKDENEMQHNVIMRTACNKKTKAEIIRDLEYLYRLWGNIKKNTLASIAPAFIYEAGDIVKKAVIEMYDVNVKEILISGNKAFKGTCDFMKIILPRHVKKAKEYQETQPIFMKHNIEGQLSSLYGGIVDLPSGGYFVINPTEALVSIDVNSGKSTSSRSVEDTALRTNLEAATKIADHIKLRDLSGLIVIDFIDMMQVKNKKKVELTLKKALTNDSAKSHIGEISSFGLLQMSRQRLNIPFHEASTSKCAHCGGTGHVRMGSATITAMFRSITNEVYKTKSDIKVLASSHLILEIINNRKKQVEELENRLSIKLFFGIDESAGIDCFFIEKLQKENTGVKTTKALSDGLDVNVSELSKITEEAEEKPAQGQQIKKKLKRSVHKQIQPQDKSLLEKIWKKIVD